MVVATVTGVLQRTETTERGENDLEARRDSKQKTKEVISRSCVIFNVEYSQFKIRYHANNISAILI